MRLLVTRPQHQVAATVAALQADGHSCIVSSLLTRHFLDPPKLADNFDIIALTSRNGLDGLVRQWPKARRDAWPVFAVGDATRDAAMAAGFTGAVSCSGNAADLVEHIGKARDEGAFIEALNAPNVLYPCALQPAHDLLALFEERELSCSAWPVYAMEEAGEFSKEALTALQAGQIDAVLLYSARSARTYARLFSVLEEKPPLPPIFALSETICGAVPLELAEKCRSASEPNEEALRFLLSANAPALP